MVQLHKLHYLTTILKKALNPFSQLKGKKKTEKNQSLNLRSFSFGMLNVNGIQTPLVKRPFSCKQGAMRLFGLLTLLFITVSNLSAQCSTCIGAVACSGGNGAVTSGTNINSGQTYWYASSGSLGSGISLNGGTLRICGNLTLSAINYNSGYIIVEAGGSLTINGGSTLYLNGNSRIYNRGTLNINRDVAMQNNNNYIINCSSSSVLNMNSGSHTRKSTVHLVISLTTVRLISIRFFSKVILLVMQFVWALVQAWCSII